MKKIISIALFVGIAAVIYGQYKKLKKEQNPIVK